MFLSTTSTTKGANLDEMKSIRNNVVSTLIDLTRGGREISGQWDIKTKLKKFVAMTRKDCVQNSLIMHDDGL